MNRYDYYNKSIIELENHARVANEEMSVIKEDIAEIKTHVHWIKEVYGDWEKRWEKLDNRIWALIAITGVGALISIAMNLYFK